MTKKKDRDKTPALAADAFTTIVGTAAVASTLVTSGPSCDLPGPSTELPAHDQGLLTSMSTLSVGAKAFHPSHNTEAQQSYLNALQAVSTIHKAMETNSKLLVSCSDKLETALSAFSTHSSEVKGSLQNIHMDLQKNLKHATDFGAYMQAELAKLHILGVNSLTSIQGLHSTNPIVANVASPAATSAMPPIADTEMAEDHSSDPSRSPSPSHDEDVVDHTDLPPPGCTWMVDKNSGLFYLWDTTTRTVVNLPTIAPLPVIPAVSAQPAPQPTAYVAVVAAHSPVDLAGTLPKSSQGVAISTKKRKPDHSRPSSLSGGRGSGRAYLTNRNGYHRISQCNLLGSKLPAKPSNL
ncbi:hypothetical protein CEUSTIGMA_g152.t1 [Chlamydomonas eustigma]|uniref:Uncharacterized protein n=1 Tax=Chlamydomonas eustigma TaxID=1157962 RepID=A0A250WPS2_9CHLO|nr:hypothetical protein CEUSTIGMA_g152.t1 [Chlamydomonas eustigma]|eukprot:GAX72696.1 hypothetical protein CEUSTIGMA_g152.t1 [Chlamydomonas eustigma]